MEVNSTWLITSELANQRTRKVSFTCVVYTNKEYPPKYYQGMRIFTPGEQRNTEYLKLKYSPSTPDANYTLRKMILILLMMFCAHITSRHDSTDDVLRSHHIVV